MLFLMQQADFDQWISQTVVVHQLVDDDDDDDDNDDDDDDDDYFDSNSTDRVLSYVWHWPLVSGTLHH